MVRSVIGLSVIVLLLLVSSCFNRNVFEEYHEFDNMSWNRFDFLKFDVPLEKSHQGYDVFLSFRHLPEFPFKEIKINMTYYLPSGEMRTQDFMLKFYDKGGKKLSECLGDYCDIEIPVRKNLFISESGTLKFEIENKRIKFETPGIMKVGLIIKKNE